MFNDCTMLYNLYSHQEYLSIPVAPHPCQHMKLSEIVTLFYLYQCVRHKWISLWFTFALSWSLRRLGTFRVFIDHFYFVYCEVTVQPFAQFSLRLSAIFLFVRILNNILDTNTLWIMLQISFPTLFLILSPHGIFFFNF